MTSSNATFQLGPWHIDAQSNLIHHGDTHIRLEPKVMDLLVYLCEHPGQTLSKDTMLEAVWGSIHHSDSVVTRAISLLRQHLDDDARKPRYIRTIPSRGYQLVAAVSEIPLHADDDSNDALPDHEPPHSTAQPQTARQAPQHDVQHAHESPATFEPLTPQPSLSQPSNTSRWLWLLAAVTILLCLIVLSVFSLREQAPSNQPATAAEKPLVNPEAEHLHAQARWHFERRSGKSMQRGHALFQQAVEADPTHAEAFSGLALSFIQQIQYLGMPADTGFAQAEAAAARALALDPNNTEAMTVQAQIHAQRDWDFEAAIALLQRAIKIDPNNLDARQYLAEQLTIIGDYDGAIQAIDQAITLQPHSTLLLGVKGLILTHAERYDEVLETMHQLSLLAPDFNWHHNYWAHALTRTGKPQEANLLLAEYHSFLSTLDDAERKTLKQSIRDHGAQPLWQAIAQKSERFKDSPLTTYQMYRVEQLVANGNDNEALALLDHVLTQRGETFLMLQVSPVYDRLRDTPAYQALMKKHGVPHGGFQPRHPL